MSENNIPAAIIYCFEEPRKLTGVKPLFTRVPIPKDAYPKALSTALASIPAMVSTIEEVRKVDSYSDDWVVHSIKVNLTRFWACDTAVFTLIRNIDPGDAMTAAPVHPEMPLTIALGWVDSLYGGPDASKLQRVFTGYVDTVSYKLTPKRVVCTVAMRDSVRFLVDNKLTAIFTEEYLTQTGRDLATEGQTTLEGSRSILIRALIRDGSGQYEDGTPAIPDERIFAAESSRPEIMTTYGGEPNDATATQYDQTSNRLQVLNKFPIEVIKHLSSVEAVPMELYSDETGNIFWTPRTTLIGKVKSPGPNGKEVTYVPKDYYFRHPVKIDSGVTDGDPQPILQGSMEWSTIGTMTNFVLGNLTSSGVSLASRAYIKSKEVHGFDMPLRTRFVFDDTTATPVAASSAFLGAMLMLWGKDVRAGSIEVRGDAGVRPARCIRIWNMGLYPPPENVFRVESVVHLYSGSGPKKGYRTSMMFSATEEELLLKHGANVVINPDIASPSGY